MATITGLKLTDTFNAFMTRVNSIITKLNTITADATTMTLAFASDPSSASQANSTAIIFVDTDGKIKLQSKNASGTVTTYDLTATE